MLSVSDHGTLLFCPLVLSFSYVFCGLLVYGFSRSLSVGNPPAQLPVSSSSDSTCFPLKGWHWPHNFCCPNWHCQPQAPDTQEICIRIDSCHLTPDKLIIPCLLTCFLPNNVPVSGNGIVIPPHALVSSLKPCLKQRNEVRKAPDWESTGPGLNPCSAPQELLELFQISEPVSSTTKWAKQDLSTK